MPALLITISTSLMALLPDSVNMTDKEIITYLKNKLGNEYLTDTLVKHFFTLGKAGEKHAKDNWMKLGLDHHKQKKMGEALQKLLVEIDSKVEEMKLDEIKGFITIDNKQVSFDTMVDSKFKHIDAYQVAII